MKTWKISLAVALLLAAVAANASPTPVDVALTAVGPIFYGAPIYPYDVTVSEGFGNLATASDSYNNHSSVGSSWTAFAIELTGGNIAGTLFQSQGVFAYEVAAYLLRGIQSDPADYSWAIWDNFGASGLPPDPAGLALLTNAQANATLADLNGVIAFTPEDTTQDELLGLGYATATPEPSSLMLLGSGVLGLAWYVRRRAL
jgi:hypothetical protein